MRPRLCAPASPETHKREGGRTPNCLEYSDYDGGSYSDKQSVGFDVDTSWPTAPSCSSINIPHPEKISPGTTSH
jgi:hypothetical protein